MFGLVWLSIQSIATQGMDSDQHLLNAVGTIYCDGKIRGSAAHITVPEKTLKHRSVILSAAHIFFDQETGQAYKSCQYRPQNKRFSAVNVEAVSSSQYAVSATDKITQAENDIVLLVPKRRLYQPSLAVSDTASTSRNLLLVAYSTDLDRITLSKPCAALLSKQPVSKHLLLHDCEAQAGTSGGAIVDAVSGKIVAIHGGALVFNPPHPNQKRDQIDPRMWINQGRIIDRQLIGNFVDKNTAR